MIERRESQHEKAHTQATNKGSDNPRKPLGLSGGSRNCHSLVLQARANMLNRMIRAELLVIFIWCLFFAGQGVRGAQTEFETTCAKLAVRTGEDSERLQELFKVDWLHTMRERPEFATAVGFRGQNNRWSDQSLEANR